MSNEKYIQQLAELVQRIEKYASEGVYDPAKHNTIISDITKAETIFNRIIDTYSDMTTMPPMQQTIDVSELQKRLHHAGHDLPSPPIEFASSSRTTDAQVAIYTLPT
ncbi:hypothetical protein ACFLVP_02785 [Chloroflexota bacterium]